MSGHRSEGAAFDPERFMTYVEKVGHGGAIGIAYRAHGPDWVELALPYRPDLVGVPATGILASGPIISLMDMATSLAVWVKLGQFRHQATMDLRIDYLKPATPGETILGRGECYGLTKRVGFVRGVAHHGDPADPIANVTGTFVATE
jgi:uncharacterized protein (TIGR00369 family)